MQSVMARRNGYIKKQVEDGIVDMKFARKNNISKVNESILQKKQNGTGINSQDVRFQASNTISTIDADVDSDSASLTNDTHLWMKDFIDTFLTTPRLEKSPQHVTSAPEGNNNDDSE